MSETLSRPEIGLQRIISAAAATDSGLCHKTLLVMFAACYTNLGKVQLSNWMNASIDPDYASSLTASLRKDYSGM